MYRLTLAEMESVFRFDRGSDEATIYTSDPAWIRRLEQMSREPPFLLRFEGTNMRGGTNVQRI